MKTIASMDRLIACLAKLPGTGRRSAERMAFELAARHDNLLPELAAAMQEVAQKTIVCSRCGGITVIEENPCFFCTNETRDSSVLCVVETAMDLLLVEKSGSFAGRYHVLGGKVSPMRGKGPDHLKIDVLRRRIAEEQIQEVILALNSDVESDATAAMIGDLLQDKHIRVSRPAMGVPAGSGIAYIDRLTLNNAIENRQILHAGQTSHDKK
ncbi:MAG: recombination mediator RecR [Kiritimatiellae bacterium]|jgi:recombination protein RecR|nr:recombination mediator RecR [Kiritimatiellia bacterium]